MADTQEDMAMETPDLEQETPPSDVFMAPSIRKADILSGASYSHFSPIPEKIAEDMSTPCVLGVDEAGRGPVLGQSSLHSPRHPKSIYISARVQILISISRPHGVCPLLSPSRPTSIITSRSPPLRRLQSPHPCRPPIPNAHPLHAHHGPPHNLRLGNVPPLRPRHQRRHALPCFLQPQRPSHGRHHLSHKRSLCAGS